jgi:hypothetical protein
MGEKKTQQTTKNQQQKKPSFFLGCSLSRFWAFLGEGSSKTPHENTKNKFDPGLFLASDPPTHHRGPRFVSSFGGPLRWRITNEKHQKTRLNKWRKIRFFRVGVF